MPAPRNRARDERRDARRPPSDDAAQALVTVAPLVNRWIERLLASHQPPLTVAQFLALQAIASEELIGTEIARRAGISGPAVSQLLAGLVGANLIARSEFEGDRRRRALRLTKAGERILRSAQKLLRERLSSLLADLPRPEADALARALPDVAATLSGAPPPPRPHPPRPPRGARPEPPL
jgi:DNA-binding MarR family transcriptional regulator